MTDEQQARAERVAYLREQIAALESYSNGAGPRAAAVRAEIANLEAPPVKMRAPQTRKAAD